MNYTHSITSKGQVTLPKEFREKLGLDKLGKATLSLNDKNQIVITTPRSLDDVRALLATPSQRDPASDREVAIGQQLAKKYHVR